jgi:hypothetical protein
MLMGLGHSRRNAVALKGEGVVRVDALEAEPGGGDDRGLAQVDDESLELGDQNVKSIAFSGQRWPV